MVSPRAYETRANITGLLAGLFPPTMKQLFTRPLFLIFILTLVFWFSLSNFVLALCCAILLSFFIGMLRSLYQIYTSPKDKS